MLSPPPSLSLPHSLTYVYIKVEAAARIANAHDFISQVWVVSESVSGSEARWLACPVCAKVETCMVPGGPMLIGACVELRCDPSRPFCLTCTLKGSMLVSRSMRSRWFSVRSRWFQSPLCMHTLTAAWTTTQATVLVRMATRVLNPNAIVLCHTQPDSQPARMMGFSAQKVTTPLSVSVGYSFQGKIVTVTYLME